ncbi:tetratricopeptide repeat protein [Leptospira sp. 96542]|nr:tetratricopeptide repeat protein [Leptospira sp. 96542]
MDKFHKKNAIDKKKEAELIQKDEFADFEGSKSELIFLKFTHFLVRNRKNVFISITVAIVLLASVIGFFEFRDYQFQKETVALEDLKILNQKNKLDLEKQIQGLEVFLKEQNTGKMELRVWKDLSKLHAEKGEFGKAAEYLENAGKRIDSPKEMKGLYFYIAGNYREHENNLAKSLENYQTASVVLETSRELNGFKAWSYYQTGRLFYLTGDKTKAKEFLEKSLKLEGAESQDDVRLLSSYLLLKLGKT